MTTVNTYASAEAFLAGGRDKRSRPIENNTRVERIDDTHIGIKLHDTYVVTYDADGTIELNSGGWLTVTTKDRINKFIRDYSAAERLTVGSDRGRWYLYLGWSNKVARFFDGVKIRGAEIVNPQHEERQKWNEAEEQRMERKINSFLDGYMKALDGEGLELPSGGDCWDCSFIVSEGPDKGKPMGDLKGGDHLIEHLKDRYYVPTLLVNAVRSRPYGNADFVLATRIDQDAVKEGKMRTRRGWGSDQPDRYAHKELRHDLRLYLRTRLMPTVHSV